MSRIACVALSLFLSAMLVAKAPAADPDLEAIAVGVMKAAYQVADYNTVEALFDKLSINNKKDFLREALTMSAVIFGRNLREGELPQTFLDLGFTVIANTEREPKPKMEDMPEMFERWAMQKSEQTQLLGRLTLSLFEQSAEKPHAAKVYPSVWQELVERRRVSSTPRQYQRPDQRPESEWQIFRQLETPVTLDMDTNVPLEKALNMLCGAVDIVPYLDRAALQEADISPDAMVRLPLVKASPFGGVLNMVLDPLGLTWVVRNEMLNITTKKQARGDTFIRSYYVGDIIPETISGVTIQDTIMSVAAPQTWYDGDKLMRFHHATQSLVIRQTEDVHAQIESLLNQMRQKIEMPHMTPYRTHGGVVQSNIVNANSMAGVTNDVIDHDWWKQGDPQIAAQHFALWQGQAAKVSPQSENMLNRIQWLNEEPRVATKYDGYEEWMIMPMPPASHFFMR